MNSTPQGQADLGPVPGDAGLDTDPDQLASARRLALESIEEDHRALERDAKLAYSPALLLG
ncbi:hypothetical protein AB0958_03160 [Streptomyces sp. NPDC006655]|uniref:hypothetical protein n=1 Tax=unclassified Streptomyces TaxID=2593676 RepID=UPI0034518C6C